MLNQVNKAMKANPGGKLAPEDVRGRDHLIDQIWARLDTQSVLVNAERRIGKTQILNKMEAESRPHWKPIYKDLEKIRTAEEFATQVYNDVQRFLGATTRAINFVRRFFEKAETDYVDIKERRWKELLSAAINDLMQSKQHPRLVFFWDEVPYMLENILSTEGPDRAAEVLDILRSLRNEHQDFRVVLTGSIGLHHILNKLTAAGIPTSATNDLYSVTVTPLSPTDANELAADLLTGENIPCDDVAESASVIAQEVDYFPYYIHHVIAGLKVEQLTATNDSIKGFIGKRLVDATDPWALAHYRTRLSTYYPDNDDAVNVAIVLDVMALPPADALTVDVIFERATTRGATLDDRNDLLQLLRVMDADHYLSRDNEGRYRFRFPMIRRWWKIDRGL